MRLISGTAGGIPIEVPKTVTRPTQDRVRQAVFSMLAEVIADARVLDLFAGTGMVSLEFASRGAASVTAIERDPKAVRHISNAFDHFELGHCRALRGDVWQFITRPITSFDVIFADPPYDLERLKELPGAILASPLLQPDGLLILEHGERTSFADEPGFVEHRHYGQVHFSFFRHLQA